MSRKLIDVDRLKKEIHENDIMGGLNYAWYIDHAELVDAVEVKHGRWLRTDAFPHRIYCSVCFKTYVTNEEVIQGRSWDCPIYAYEAEYCPHCGAKMDGEVKSDEGAGCV